MLEFMTYCLNVSSLDLSCYIILIMIITQIFVCNAGLSMRKLTKGHNFY